MKRIFFVLIAIIFLLHVNAQNVGLTRLYKSKAPMHSWIYMPSGDSVTHTGLKSNQYPLMQVGEPTYLESEYIGIVNCDLEMAISYFITTKTTKSIKIELIDKQENIVYTHINDNRQVNQSMQVVETVKIGLLENVSTVKIRMSLSAANKEGDAINVDELQLYSTNGENIVESVVSQCQNISIEGHTLIVDSNIDSTIEVYTITGALISKNAISKGINRIILSSGLYLIKLNNYSQKISIP